jgi:hypothetical protein
LLTSVGGHDPVPRLVIGLALGDDQVSLADDVAAGCLERTPLGVEEIEVDRSLLQLGVGRKDPLSLHLVARQIGKKVEQDLLNTGDRPFVGRSRHVW